MQAQYESTYELIIKWDKDNSYWDKIFKDINFTELLQYDIDLTWGDLQYIGGFYLPSNINYLYVNPDSIFERLYYLIDTNIISVSELTKNGPYNVTSKIVDTTQYTRDGISIAVKNRFANTLDKSIEIQIQMMTIINIVLILYENIKPTITNTRTQASIDMLKEVVDLYKKARPTLQDDITKNITKNIPDDIRKKAQEILDDITMRLNIYGCTQDTGFIVKCYSENQPICDKNVVTDFSDKSLLQYNDLQILSIHFDSKGPNGDKEPVNIMKFIEEQFKKLKFSKDNKVNVICGDTNITESKSNASSGQLSRDEIGKQIAAGLNAYFFEPGTEWLVLMSSHKIIKNRIGFKLQNQQVSKSVIMDPIGEADGTILAIKIYTDKKADIIINWIRIFSGDDTAADFIIYSAGSSDKINNSVTTYKSSDAFDFTTKPSDSLKPNNSPSEKIFIDHSVLYSALEFLDKHVKKEEITSFTFNPTLKNKQLIVLNLNSMVNNKSKHKDWNLKIKDYLAKVELYDKALYDTMKEIIYKKEKDTYTLANMEYEKITGLGKLYYRVLNDTELDKLIERVKEAFNKVKKAFT